MAGDQDLVKIYILYSQFVQVIIATIYRNIDSGHPLADIICKTEVCTSLNKKALLKPSHPVS